MKALVAHLFQEVKGGKMRTHTEEYKTEIKNLGRQIDALITYFYEGGLIKVGNDKINSINFNYEGGLLKSVMKVLKVDCNVELPKNTIIRLQFGVKVRDSEVYLIDYRQDYDYVDFGYFIVDKVEKQKDTNSYLLTCYDKMLYSMVDYEDLGVTYPITVRDYISAICTKLGLTFANSSDTFVNYNKNITEELFLDADGNSMSYTFRDVLDQLAEITASTICINNSNELELRYITDSQETIEEESLKNINVNFGELYGAINTIVFSRSNGLDKISKSIPIDLPDEDKIALEIAENRFLNDDDRSDYIDGILNQLYGLQYCVNDFDSVGITYLDLCDKYDVVIGNETYPCIMFSDEINIKRGLSETIHTEKPKENVQEYKYMTETDKNLRNAEIIINKKIGEVDIKGKTINLTADDIAIDSTYFKVTKYGAIQATSANITGTITGSTIIGGTIQSTNYTPASGSSDGAGTIINLSNGDITSYGAIRLDSDNIAVGDIWISGQNIDGVNSIVMNNELDGLDTYTIDALGISLIDVGTNRCSISTETINFHHTFKNPPVVVVTPKTTVNGSPVLKVNNVTTTSFNIVIGGTTFQSEIDFNWIAYGL